MTLLVFTECKQLKKEVVTFAGRRHPKTQRLQPHSE
jgi:hypothetical protein